MASILVAGTVVVSAIVAGIVVASIGVTLKRGEHSSDASLRWRVSVASTVVPTIISSWEHSDEHGSDEYINGGDRNGDDSRVSKVRVMVVSIGVARIGVAKYRSGQIRQVS